MMKTLKYSALIPSLVLGTLSFLAIGLLEVPLSSIPFEKLVLAALQIIFYLLASYDLIKNRFKSACVYTSLAALIYLVSAVYDLGGVAAFAAAVHPVFFVGLLLRVLIAGACGRLAILNRAASGRAA